MKFPVLYEIIFINQTVSGMKNVAEFLTLVVKELLGFESI